jgi:hypothetical protein
MDNQTPVPLHSNVEQEDSSNEDVLQDSTALDSTESTDSTDSADPVDPADSDAEPSEEVSEEEAPRKDLKPRYTRVLRFVVAPILVALAVVCGILAGLTATIWKPDPKATATASTSTRYVVTDPGVLPLGNEQVAITVTSSSPVCVAIGSTQDVSGWIASHKYTRVKGLSSWSELATSVQTAAADTSAADASDSTLALEDSDMWLTSECGTGTLTLPWKVTSTSQSLIVDTNPSGSESDASGAKAALSLTWIRTQVLNLTIPLIFVAALLLVCAVLCATVFAMAPHRRRKVQAATAGGELAGVEESSAESGLDSPRWVNDHVAAQDQHGHTSHRKKEKPARSGFFSRKRSHDTVGDEGAEQAPTIVDVGNVNMVARQQEEAEGPATTTISSNDMAEYFARLAQERLGDDETGEAYESEASQLVVQPEADADAADTSDAGTDASAADADPAADPDDTDDADDDSRKETNE